MAVSATYASPGLRWGLMLEDHPGAWVEFCLDTGASVGVPKAQGGDEEFVIAVVNFPEGSGRRPVVGYKAMKSKIKGDLDHPSDRYNILCTKALGRALKRAGYPDDMVDLKALVVWRQREAEIGAIRVGTAQIALTPSRPELALEAAGRRDPESTGGDDGNAPVTDGEGGDDVDARSGDPTLSPASDVSKAELRKTINGLGPRSSMLTTWAKEHGYRVTRPGSEAECLALIDHGRFLLTGEEPESLPAPPGPDHPPEAENGAEAPAEGPSVDAATVAELVAGLSEDEARSFAGFCKTLEIDPTGDWAAAPAEHLTEVLAWLTTD